MTTEDPNRVLTLRVSQINTILHGLGEIPAKHAYDVIKSIEGQVLAQANAAAQAQAALAAPGVTASADASETDQPA